MPRKPLKITKGTGRRSDWADDEAEELFESVRAAEPDEQVVQRIASALRSARLIGESDTLEAMRELLDQRKKKRQ